MSMTQDFYKQKSILKYHNNEGKKHILVVCGGMSAEREISFMSGKAIIEVLILLGYRVTECDMGADFASVVESAKPDIVFNALHGTYGEDGRVPAILDIMHVPYTHTGVLGSVISLDKGIATKFFKNLGIRTIKNIVVRESDGITKDPMARPFIIKPCSQGSSKGLELITADSDFDFKNYDFPYGDILVEKFIKGREMQVAILNGKALGVLEVEIKEGLLYDYKSKYTPGNVNYLCPADIDKATEKEALEVSEKIFEELSLRGIARSEFILSDEDNQLYILEINTHPGFTPYSICNKIALKQGMDFANLIEAILASAKYD